MQKIKQFTNIYPKLISFTNLKNISVKKKQKYIPEIPSYGMNLAVMVDMEIDQKFDY